MQERLKDIFERITGSRPDSGEPMQPSIDIMMDAYEQMERKVAMLEAINKNHLAPPKYHGDKIFDLEQAIMNCWNMVDDTRMLNEYITDHEDFEGMDADHADKIGNLLLGTETMYQLKFQNTFELFEDVCREYHRRNKCIDELEKEVDFVRRTTLGTETCPECGKVKDN